MILDRFKLTNQVAIVTGAGRGIGEGVALAYAEAGADVVCAARSVDQIEDTAARVRELGRRALAVPCDVLERSQLESLVDATMAEFGRIDVLVNNAGGWPPRMALDTSEKDFEAAFRFNVTSAFALTRLTVPHMAKGGGGAIVNISSISGFKASVRSAPYAAVKAAVNNYTASQALTLAPKRIRVNAIAPGSIEFPGGVWDQRKTADPNLYNNTLKSIPWGRMGGPEEIASVAAFLASDLASWVTGQTIAVDGGQLLG